MNNNEVWRLHCLGWTVPEIAERLSLTESNVRKRINVCWAFNIDGSKADGADSDEDRRNRTSKGHKRR